MDRLTQRANQAATLLVQVAGTSYTVQPQDLNCTLAFTSATPVAVTLPNDAPLGFSVELLQVGTGPISTQPAAGASQVSPAGAGFGTAGQYASLRCKVIGNVGGAAAVWNVASPTAGGGTASGVVYATSYAAIRASAFAAGSVAVIILTDPNKGGTFVRASAATSGLLDNGGTQIRDGLGQVWVREIESRISAAWFYDCPGHYLGDGSAVAITAADQAANPQWVGLPAALGGGPYPVGMTWASVAIMQAIYACFAFTSTPAATLQGSITSAILAVSAWISGPQGLVVGAAISGPNIASGTQICLVEDPTHYGVGIPQGTGSIDHLTTPTCDFHAYITSSFVMVVNQIFSGALQIGQLITSPAGGTLPFGAFLPGTRILQQTQQTPGDGPGLRGQYIVGVSAQDVPNETIQVIGGPLWNSSSSQLNLPLWLPHGNMPINQPFYLSCRGCDIEFAEKAGSQLLWQGANNVSPIQFDAISYGAVRKLTLADQVGVAGVPLVDINWTGANPGLKTQQLTFYDWLVGGTEQADSVGVYVARHGGDAQGDTIVFITPSIFYCYTGLVAGGANALNITVVGGNIQGNYKNGVVAYGGSFQLYSTSLQLGGVEFHTYPQASAIALDGADAYIYPGGGATARCALRDVRSENIVMCYDRNRAARVDNCSIAQAYYFYGWAAGAHQHLGMLITTNGLINKVVMCVDDGGPSWFAADASSTNTRLVKQGPSPNWVPGQWVGFTRWFRYGNSSCQAGGPITANDANSVTDPNGWYSAEPYPGFTPGQLAGYLAKIAGISGAVQPAWDSYPPGSTIGLVQTPGYGLTVNAGSNVVSGTGVAPTVANGQYMVVCDAIRVQAPPTSTTIVSGALIGKVQNLTPGASFTASVTAGVLTVSAMTSGAIKIGALVNGPTWGGTIITGQLSGTPNGVGTYSITNPQQPDAVSRAMTTSIAWELVNSLGEPQLATRYVLDASGYWGAGIPDGLVTWLPIDFDVLSGVASGDGIDPGGFGKFRECGLLNLAFPISGSRFRPMNNGATLGNFSYRNANSSANALVNFITAAGNTTLTAQQIAQGPHATITNALANFTLNMPVYLDNLTQEFRLFITNNNAAGVLTWGTNVKATNPTLALGAVGKQTIVTLTWVGSPVGAGSWYVGNAQGPM